MITPRLIVITGRPASGKTTLAHRLSKETGLPLISRDELKQGFVYTSGLSHNEVDRSTDLMIYDTFFETVELLVSKGISIIIEAAYQHKLWEPKLTDLLNKANIKIIICNITPAAAKTRFNQRLSADPDRKRFHGDAPITSDDEHIGSLIDNYQPVNIDAPTMLVETTGDYIPILATILDFVSGPPV